MFGSVVREWAMNNGVQVIDPEEEVFEIYTRFYDAGQRDRENWADPAAQELEISIEGGKRPIELTIHQNPNVNNSLGQTGGVVWNCSVIMSRFFARIHKQAGWPLEQARGIELGAGCGVVGLVLHLMGTRHMILTDQPRLLRLLEHNAAANGVTTSARGGVGGKRGKQQKPVAKGAAGSDSKKPNAGCLSNTLYITDLEWDKPIGDAAITNEPLNFAVVSDCVYHEDVAPLLVSALKQLGDVQPEGHDIVFFVGQELRSELVHETFLQEMLEHFVMYRVPADERADNYLAFYVAWPM